VIVSTLHIEHAITDFHAWAAAFARFDEARRTAGVRDERVHRPVGDPNFVVVDLDFDSREEATEFLHFLESVVWQNPANSPALVGTPRALVLERATAGAGAARSE
jgi:hypothetical protein